MMLATCGLGVVLWVGSIRGHATRCCVDFFSTGTPPPDRAAMLGIDAQCRMKTHRRRWRRRHQLYGIDDNGLIRLTLCRSDGTDCCELTAVGPSDPVVTPKPTHLVGTYVCPEESGTYTLDAVPEEGR